MKKRKPPERNRPDFSNNPFSSLKNIKPAAMKPVGPEKARPRAVPSGDEGDLFRRAVSGARPLHQDKNPALDGVPQAGKTATDAEDTELFLRAMSGMRRLDPNGPAPAAGAADDEDRRLFTTALRTMKSSLPPDRPEDEEESSPRSRSSRMKQLKRGTIRISEELDLHGCLRDEALNKLKLFIAESSARGHRAVLVITGKGINSPDGPVLQSAVADWLRGPGKNLVAEFTPAPRERGGSGAYVVFLKNA